MMTLMEYVYVYTVCFFLYTANSIYIWILICKYVINVMDLWMICYWGTIFVMTTSSANDLQTGSQGSSPKMSILTGLRQDVSGLYLNICLNMDDQLQNFVDGLFFFQFICFLVTQQENTFEPHPFD